MAEPPGSHEWQPLTDLSTAELAAASGELPALATTWDERRSRLRPGQVEDFNRRLQREWAIETGIIEQVYTLDRGTTQLLIERGIDVALIGRSATDQSPELVAGIIDDQGRAVDWLFDLVKQHQDLSVSFVKQLHALMTRRQPYVQGVDQFDTPTRAKLRHGDYKTEPNNPSRPDGSSHEYCPPLQVAPEMDRLILLHHEHQATGIAPEVEAAWLHHRFTQIHPFQDGNGRVARALSSLVLIRAGWFPLVVLRDDRVRYIDALESADRGDLQPLIELTVAVERRAFISALSISEEVSPEPERVDQVIDAIGDLFRARDATVPSEPGKATRLAHRMWTLTVTRLETVRDELQDRVTNGTGKREVLVDTSSQEVDSRGTLGEWVKGLAVRLGYVANLEVFHEWAVLGLDTETGHYELVISFHGLGPASPGLVGVTAGLYPRSLEESSAPGLQPMVDEVFQINDNDDPASVERRFKPWLETALIRGLDAWRRNA